jgi:hypothetical protein
MRYVLLSITAIAALAVAYFAHRHLGRHVPGGGARLALLRMFLLAIGALFGHAAATAFGASGLYYALVFLAGFGVVHVPAATILLIKDERAK